MARRKIAGSRALVTGASSGIGREIAFELARQRARLLVVARREDRLAALRDRIHALGGEAHLVVGDVTEPGLRAALIEAAQTQLGGLDILVNNAATTRIGPFVESEPDHLRRIMDVNFFAPVELTRAALPLLRKANKPIVVNVGSVLGHRAVPKKAEYCASKFALHGFSDSLRAELAPLGIDVLLVSPSTTKTEIFDRAIGDKSDLPWIGKGGMRPEIVARKTVQAIRCGRHEVILSLGGKLLVWLDRLLPTLTNHLIARFG